MIYHKEAYRLFVNALLLALRDKEFKDIPEVYSSPPGYYLWAKEINKEVRSLRIASNIPHGKLVFDDILQKGQKIHKKADRLTIEGFKYIGGVELPEKLKHLDMEPHTKASILFQVFLEQSEEGRILLDLHTDLYVFDDNGLIGFSEKKSGQSLIDSQNKTPDFSSSPNVVIKNDDDYDYLLAQRTVEQFFANINNQQLNKSWEMLTLGQYYVMRTLSEFTRGYTWTVSIHNLQFLGLKRKYDNLCETEYIECLVYCCEDFDLHSSFDVLELGKIDKHSMERLFNAINYVRAGMEYFLGEYLGDDKERILKKWDEYDKDVRTDPYARLPIQNVFRHLYEIRVVINKNRTDAKLNFIFPIQRFYMENTT